MCEKAWWSKDMVINQYFVFQDFRQVKQVLVVTSMSKKTNKWQLFITDKIAGLV